jgi:CCR4-NOT transcription complex subunit 2
MTDPDLNTLALGTDLTTLGLNLSSTEVLYATFAFPASTSSPTTSHPADYVLPYCYYMQPPALKTSHLSKFTLETLFYIFYCMPRDTLQVYASKELYSRDWRYHKDIKLWLTRGRGASTENGQIQLDEYLFFDVQLWETRIFRDTHILQPHKFLTEEELANI